jgi:hypothetical protein
MDTIGRLSGETPCRQIVNERKRRIEHPKSIASLVYLLHGPADFSALG